LIKKKESDKLTSTIKDALFKTVLFEVGAFGFATLFSASLIDFSGILPAGMAATGLLVLPYKRERMKDSLKKQIGEIRSTLKDTLQHHFNFEMEQSIKKLKINLSPYTDFVTKEQIKINGSKVELEKSRKQIEEFYKNIENLFGKDSKDS